MRLPWAVVVPDELTGGARDAKAGGVAKEFFDHLWAEKDPWDLDRSDLDQRRYARQLELVGDRRYERALELGCAAGSFTRYLSAVCDHLLALDIAQDAVSRAQASRSYAGRVEFQVANIMEFDMGADGPWDLVVLTETAYYLGWLYPMFDVGWLAHSLYEATNVGGRLLLANTISSDNGLMSPWLIRTYRDLFANAGYDIEAEESLRGAKDTVEFEILLSLFSKASR